MSIINPMNASEIRQKFLKFFEERGHVIISSSFLVPEGDNTTLFTGSGMQPLIKYLLGESHPAGRRLVNSQKSFRAEDIDEVGDNRHTTFFEMLGNWSLGEYFKEEQLPWFFEFLTDIVGLDPQKLYVTVFAGDKENNIPRDDESVAIWQRLFKEKGIEAKAVELMNEECGNELGLQGGRIFYYGDKNLWSRAGAPAKMPAREPGGPDSEVFYEFLGVEHNTKFGAHCHPNCDCGRFVEIGNSVFMEYVKTERGFEKLKQRNVDFGGGLERITAASNNTSDVFHIDSLKVIVDKIQTLAQKQDLHAERIIADHLRAAVFLLADGVTPSNKDRGYILRRLIRRSVTCGQKIGIEQDFTSEIVKVVVEVYKQVYSELNQGKIGVEIKKEELKFRETLGRAMVRFDEVVETFINGQLTDKILQRHTVFDLFQSYGLPFETIKELAKEKGIGIDEVAFEEDLNKHQELSRTQSAGQFKGGLASHSDKTVRLHTATHLMNAALRKVLGENVWQKGSNITEERTRFDFTHDAKMTDEQKQEVEKLVNDWISRDLSVKKEVMPLEEARKLGAIGVFGEKYPDTVSVYTVLDSKNGEVVSREFCGGPHVEHTGVIGKFKIQKEEAVAAGVRRIKAVIE